MGKKKTESTIVSPFLDVTEAAIYLKMAKGTVYQMIHKKGINKLPVRYIGRKPIFLIEELKEWILQYSKKVA